MGYKVCSGSLDNRAIRNQRGVELMFINVDSCDHAMHRLLNHRLCPFHNWRVMSINLGFHSH